MITQKQILASRSWLQDLKDGKGGEIVIGPDNDGWLCGLLLTNMGATVRGVYNNRELVLPIDCQRSILKYIDVDIAIPQITSLGHHITSYSPKHLATHLYNPNGLQLNDLFGVSVRNSKSPKSAFSYKYPLSTILFLLWLFEVDLDRFTETQKNFILQADGVLNNVANYPHSVLYWMERFPSLKKLFDTEQYNLLDYYMHSNEYREMRKNSISSKSAGQGKGIEKGKVLFVNPHGEFVITQKKFIENFGKSVGFPYIPERWQCWTNMELYQFNSGICACKPVATFSDLLSRPEKLVSLIFSDTTGRISFTEAEPDLIQSAFGI